MVSATWAAASVSRATTDPTVLPSCRTPAPTTVVDMVYAAWASAFASLDMLESAVMCKFHALSVVLRTVSVHMASASVCPDGMEKTAPLRMVPRSVSSW